MRINGAVQMAAGALLALGRFPRLSALAMAGTLVPHAGRAPLSEAGEERDQVQQRIHFLKNLSMFGGLLIAAADTAGNPSLAWRTRHAAKTAAPGGVPGGPDGQGEREGLGQGRPPGWPSFA